MSRVRELELEHLLLDGFLREALGELLVQQLLLRLALPRVGRRAVPEARHVLLHRRDVRLLRFVPLHLLDVRCVRAFGWIDDGRMNEQTNKQTNE